MSYLDEASEEDLLSIISRAKIIPATKKNVTEISGTLTGMQNIFGKTLTYMNTSIDLQRRINILKEEENKKRQQMIPLESSSFGKKAELKEAIEDLGEQLDKSSHHKNNGGSGGSSSILKSLALLGITGVATDIGVRLFEGQSLAQIETAEGSGVVGFGAGALAGAKLGSVFGSPGKVIGGALGGIGGFLAGTKIGDTVYNATHSKSSSEGYAKRFSDYLSTTVTNINQSVSLNPLSIMSGKTGGLRDMIDSFGEGGNYKPAGDSAHALQAMTYFQKQGWSKAQAAGIVGNLQQESGPSLDPHAHNSINMYGIAQWDTTRRKEFQNVYKKDIYSSTFEEQLAYVQYELTKGARKNAGKRLREVTDAKSASLSVQNFYEGAPGQDTGKRISNANSLAAETGFIARAGKGVGAVKGAPGNIMKYIKLADSGVNIKDVNPSVMYRFKAMAADYMSKTGKKITVNSGYRSREKQAALYAKSQRQGGRPPTARPGRSRHEHGFAIDINSSDGEMLQKLGLLDAFGFNRPVPGEKWHIEPVEGSKIPRLSETEEADLEGHPLMVAQGGKGAVLNGNAVKSVDTGFSLAKTSGANSFIKKDLKDWKMSKTGGPASASYAPFSHQGSNKTQVKPKAKVNSLSGYIWYFLGK